MNRRTAIRWWTMAGLLTAAVALADYVGVMADEDTGEVLPQAVEDRIAGAAHAASNALPRAEAAEQYQPAGDYALISDLEPLATTNDVADLEAQLANYALTTDLLPLATTNDVAAVEAQLANYALTTDLLPLATTNDVAAVEAQLMNYALTTDLEPFATTNDVAAVEAQLMNYALTTDLEPLATTGDVAAVEAQLENYVRTNHTGDVKIVGRFAQGNQTTASGSYSHAEGQATTASGTYSHAAGYRAVATHDYSTVISGMCADTNNYLSAGDHTIVLASDAGVYLRGPTYLDGVSVATTNDVAAVEAQLENYALTTDLEPFATTNDVAAVEAQLANYALTTDLLPLATTGDVAAVEAQLENYVRTNHTGDVKIVGTFAQGYETTASGQRSHAEGISTTASGAYSHAEGNSTTASGGYSHAEGAYTAASGYASHAEGYKTTASNYYSHAEGYQTTASGVSSHAAGYKAVAEHDYSTVISGMCADTNDYLSAGNHTIVLASDAGIYLRGPTYLGGELRTNWPPPPPSEEWYFYTTNVYQESYTLPTNSEADTVNFIIADPDDATGNIIFPSGWIPDGRKTVNVMWTAAGPPYQFYVGTNHLGAADLGPMTMEYLPQFQRWLVSMKGWSHLADHQISFYNPSTDAMSHIPYD